MQPLVIILIILVVLLATRFVINEKNKKTFIENTDISIYILKYAIKKIKKKNIKKIIKEPLFVAIYLNDNVDINVKKIVDDITIKNGSKLDIYIFDGHNYEEYDKCTDLTDNFI